MKPGARLVHGYLQQRALLDRLVEANDQAELKHRLGEIRKLLPLLPQVLDGEPTADFPNVCLVWNKDTPGLYWSGTYLGPGASKQPVVLTCKHAITHADGYRVALPLSLANARTADNTYEVAKVLLHASADAALLFLDESRVPPSAAFYALAEPADFAQVSAHPAGYPLTFCGFGEIDDREGQGAKRKKTGATVRSDQPFGPGMATFNGAYQFVAGGEQGSLTTDVCEGDSGGPAFFPKSGGLAVLGVVARSVKDYCGVDGSIFTRVDAIREWIRQSSGI